MSRAVADLGDHPRQLTAHVRPLGEGAQAVGPARVELAGADCRLGDVIDDERLLRVAIDERDCLRQVLRVNQHVVDEAVPARGRRCGLPRPWRQRPPGAAA